MAQRLGSDSYQRQATAEQARLHIAQHDLGVARRWRANAGLDDLEAAAGATDAEGLVLARLLLAERRWREASSLLRQLVEDAAAQGHTGSLVKLQLLMALALHCDDRQAGALHALEQAVTLAEPGGYLRSFLDEGPPVVELLRKALNIGAWGLRATDAGSLPRAYARMILLAFEAPEQVREVGQVSHPAADALPLGVASRDALSTRALDVLRLMARGASNQEIADTLVISVGTVKSHLNHIMGKLGAHNRTEAVVLARERGWLPH